MTQDYLGSKGGASEAATASFKLLTLQKMPANTLKSYTNPHIHMDTCPGASSCPSVFVCTYKDVHTKLRHTYVGTNTCMCAHVRMNTGPSKNCSAPCAHTLPKHMHWQEAEATLKQGQGQVTRERARRGSQKSIMRPGVGEGKVGVDKVSG